MSIPQATDHPLLTAINPAHYIDGDRFMEHRASIIEGESLFCAMSVLLIYSVILLNVADQLKSRLEWATSKKPFIYRCLNLLVSSMASNDKVSQPLPLLSIMLILSEHPRSPSSAQAGISCFLHRDHKQDASNPRGRRSHSQCPAFPQILFVAIAMSLVAVSHTLFSDTRSDIKISSGPGPDSSKGLHPVQGIMTYYLWR
jgi:hypothetical protein